MVLYWFSLYIRRYIGSTDCLFNFPLKPFLASDIYVTGDKFEICHHLIVCCGNLTEPTGLKSFRWLSGHVNWKDRLQTRLYHEAVLCLNLWPFYWVALRLMDRRDLLCSDTPFYCHTMKSKINGVGKLLLMSVRPLLLASSPKKEASLMQIDKRGIWFVMIVRT